MAPPKPPPVWRLKVELLDVRPAIWRRFDTFADEPLSLLHDFIQAAMGWENAHLFAFLGSHRGEFDTDARLRDVCRVGQAITYVYDFGDDWRHLVSVEKEMPISPGPYPRLIAGKQACPPEDCGGPWGYADMVKLLAGRHSPRRREIVDWLGGPFDPKAFDLDDARNRLAGYASTVEPDPDA